MSEEAVGLADALRVRFGEIPTAIKDDRGETTLEVAPDKALSLFTALRDEAPFKFAELIDVCGVDYAAYGDTEWATVESTGQGFSRGVSERTIGRGPAALAGVSARGSSMPNRFAAVYHLLSLEYNQRLRVRVFASDDDLPVVPSLVDLWPSANWFEREAFDLFGIVFDGHPDLRRLLTDYGFVGHPFRKDFPLIGHVEMRYDPERGRVIYEPVSIEPRVLVPRVIRKDQRYGERTRPQGAADA